MKREIKFRFWVEAAKKMSDWETAIKECNRLSLLGLDGFIPMQFTGLKDKNDVDIYEGDIVNFAVKKRFCKNDKCEHDLELGINRFCPNCGTPVKDSDFVTTSKIVFDKGGFCFWTETDEYYQAWQTYIAEIYIEWKEVIGNIYEHPDLKP